jgi:hypothetical protein
MDGSNPSNYGTWFGVDLCDISLWRDFSDFSTLLDGPKEDMFI